MKPKKSMANRNAEIWAEYRKKVDLQQPRAPVAEDLYSPCTNPECDSMEPTPSYWERTCYTCDSSGRILTAFGKAVLEMVCDEVSTSSEEDLRRRWP